MDLLYTFVHVDHLYTFVQVNSLPHLKCVLGKSRRGIVAGNIHTKIAFGIIFHARYGTTLELL